MTNDQCSMPTTKQLEKVRMFELLHYLENCCFHLIFKIHSPRSIKDRNVHETSLNRFALFSSDSLLRFRKTGEITPCPLQLIRSESSYLYFS